MSLFARKPKHVHEWSPWSRERRNASQLSRNRDFFSWIETINVRRCTAPQCGFTQEQHALIRREETREA